MEIALSSVVASSQTTKLLTPITAATQGIHDVSSSVANLLKSPGGFNNETAINSRKGLALLAALSLNNKGETNGFKKSVNGFKSNGCNSSVHQTKSTGVGAAMTTTSVITATLSSAAVTSVKRASSSSIEASSTTTNKTSNTNTNINTNTNTNANKVSSNIKNLNDHQQTTAAVASATVPVLSAAALLTAVVSPDCVTVKAKTKARRTSLSVTTTSSTPASITTKNEPSTETTTPTTPASNGTSKHIPSDILDDLACRFIINVPDMELSNLIRICFQIELAHWFYLDFYCTQAQTKKLHSCGIKAFAKLMFQHVPFLKQHLSTVDKILDDWKSYKQSVPTFGAILISEDLKYCILVQSYFAKCSWGFPKGKVNENEDPVHCAAREVFEETGVDITELIVPNDYIEAVVNYQFTRLYIVRNIPINTQFAPRTRNEIKSCDWFPIDSLPTSKNDAISKAKLGINANSFFMIMPFMKRLKKWVNEKRAGIEKRCKRSLSGSQVALPPMLSTSPLSSPLATPISSSNTKSSVATTVGTSVSSGSYMLSGSYSNSQKQTSANSCSKKSKQVVDKNALNNAKKINSGGYSSVGANTTTGVTDVSSTSTATTLSSSSSSASSFNRSKRQRHKSMGDLDGIKLNSLNNQNNHKASNAGAMPASSTLMPGVVSGVGAAAAATVIANGNGNTHKRNSLKMVAAGSNGLVNNNSHHTSTKRQLFQSQNGTPQGEKVVSSFDLIRKEKQQQIKAVAQAEKGVKAQKTNGMNGVNGRVRAKSQSEKTCTQPINSKFNHSGNNNNNNKQRLQRQQTMYTSCSTNSSSSNSNSNSNSHSNNISGVTTMTATTGTTGSVGNTDGTGNSSSSVTHVVSPPITGNDLIAMLTAAAAAAAATATATASPTPTPKSPRPKIHTPAPVDIQTYGLSAASESKTSTSTASVAKPQQVPQEPALKFTPSFNSWTNFSFTKNFITNVFC